MQRRRFAQSLLALLVLCTGCNQLVQMANTGISAKQYDKIRPGMSEQQLVQLLGKPQKRMLVSGGENGDQKMLILRWLSNNQLITVTLSTEGVVGKEKV